MDKTYPIGTKIKYIGYCTKCKDKIGKVIKIHDSTYTITLPQSTCYAAVNRGGTIVCSWSDIVPVPVLVKGQQLLFSFME